MDFSLPAPLIELRDRVRAFVDQQIIPREAAIEAEDQVGGRPTLAELRSLARSEGLWVPHLPEAWGGLEQGLLGMCTLFREMGRSPYGAKVFNCDAPDQGNMDLLLAAGSDAIRERWLRPLIDGDITSAFCMTEPAPGAGSDPSSLRTTATREGDAWVIRGRKWYSTGGSKASFLIVMARTSDDPKRGATMFVVDRNTPGVEVVRDVPVMADDVLDHVETEFTFEEVRVPSEAILGQVGAGFRLAQVRLVPARLTHCMRWLGLADRALQMCRTYINERVSFGRRLAEHQAIQIMLAESATGIHAGNLMTFHCATMIERGDEQTARAYSSMTKTHVARLLCKVLDDAIQMHGGLGYSNDLPFARWYRSARAARIADGPDEVHQMLVAREVLKGRLDLLDI